MGRSRLARLPLGWTLRSVLDGRIDGPSACDSPVVKDLVGGPSRRRHAPNRARLSGTPRRSPLGATVAFTDRVVSGDATTRPTGASATSGCYASGGAAAMPRIWALVLSGWIVVDAGIAQAVAEGIAKAQVEIDAKHWSAALAGLLGLGESAADDSEREQLAATLQHVGDGLFEE